ncbi:MAG: aminoglycoside N(3)-acetyltransferase [Traorella sp.]
MEEMLTKEDFKAAMQRLGVKKGMLLYVSASLDEFPCVIGGAQAIIEALMDIVGYDGTIVMPSFTYYLCDPIEMKDVPRDRVQEARRNSLAFDKRLSIPKDSGEVSIQFMRNEAVLRSNHPMVSFLAWGKYAKLIVEKHPLHFGMNHLSPLGKIKEYNGYVITIGNEYQDCEIFHVAQYMTMKCPIRIYSCPIDRSGSTSWIQILDLELNHDSYNKIGEIMEERQLVKTTYIGSSTCRMFSAKVAIEGSLEYFNKD